MPNFLQLIASIPSQCFLHFKVFMGDHHINSEVFKSCTLLIQDPDKDFNSGGLTLSVICPVFPPVIESH